VGAFVAAHAPEEVAELEEAATFMDDDEGGDHLTGEDRAYLGAVVPLLDSYPEMRMGVGE
jgi:hypothetical protein